MITLRLKGTDILVQCIEDIIKGEFKSYLNIGQNSTLRNGVPWQLIELKDSIQDQFEFPEDKKDKSELLQYLKFNELELYNKIEWY